MRQLFEITLVKFDAGPDAERQAAIGGYLSMLKAYKDAKKHNKGLSGKGFGTRHKGFKASGVDLEPS